MKYLTKLAAMTGLGLALSGCGLRHPDYQTKQPLAVGEDSVRFEEKLGSNILRVTQKDTTQIDYIMRPKDELTLDEVCITATDKTKRCFSKGKIAGEILPEARKQNVAYLGAIYDSNRAKWVNLIVKK